MKLIEKLTHAVTYWPAICFLRFRGFFSGCSGFSWSVPGFFWGVLGFLGSVPGFLGVFRVFWRCSWFFDCSGMFRDVPVFRCSWKYYMPVAPAERIIMGLSRCFFVWFLEIVGGYCYGLKDSVECGGFLRPFLQN